MQYGFQRGRNEIGIVDDDIIGHVIGERFLRFSQFRLNRIDRFQRVRVTCQRKGDSGRRFPVCAGDKVIVRGIEFDACHIFQMHHATVRVRPEYNFFKLLRIRQPPVHRNLVLKLLGFGRRI